MPRTLKSGERELVLKVKTFCESEKCNTTPIIPLECVRQRVAVMTGVASDALEVFLLQELTAKGLKKFGSSVEQTYCTIQNLVVKQLNIVGQHLTYYLADLRGLTRFPDRYKILGIEESLVTEAIRACCAFLNKSLELQQVIYVSMQNYKSFFRWLFVAILRLLDEPIPSEIAKISQQELGHIAEFLYNFDSVSAENNESMSEKPMKFNLERLGQYLQDQNLTILPDDEESPWQAFLKENSCVLKDNDTVFSMSEFKKFSLVQQQTFLRKSIEKIFDFTHKGISKNVSLLYNLKFHENKLGCRPENFRVSQVYDPSENRFLIAFIDTDTQNKLCFMCINILETACSAGAIKLFFTGHFIKDVKMECHDILPIIDLQFYSSEYLSVLLKHPECIESTVFVQLPVKLTLLESINDFNIKSKAFVFTEESKNVNIAFLYQDTYKVLDKMDGNRIAVSGGRKVAVVLSRSCRKVRVYEMEVDGEYEEEETLDSISHSNTTLKTESDQHNMTSEDTAFSVLCT